MRKPTTADMRIAFSIHYIEGADVGEMAQLFDEWLAEVKAATLEKHAVERYEAHLESPNLPLVEQPSQMAKHYKSAADSLRSRAAAYRQERKEQCDT